MDWEAQMEEEWKANGGLMGMMGMTGKLSPIVGILSTLPSPPALTLTQARTCR